MRSLIARAMVCLGLSMTVLARAQVFEPDVNAGSAILVDAASGRVLFEKGADLRRPPASTTKVMTGLLVAERLDPDAIVTAPRHVRDTGGSSMHLLPGEQIRADDLLYAIMLRSANDGCHAAAVHIAGSDKAFADLMNARAQELGCTATHFVNPHGLHHPEHLTTARDLAFIACAALKNPRFAQVVATQKHTVQRDPKSKDTLMVNRDKWLSMDPRARGVKTGWTVPAGHCFVGCASDEGMTVVSVILDSPDWVFDQQVLTAYAFDAFERRVLVHQGETVGSVPVENGDRPTLDLVATDDVAAVVLKAEEGPVEVELNGLTVKAPVKAGALVRTAPLTMGSVRGLSVSLCAGEDVKERPVWQQNVSTPAGLGGFAVLVGGAMVVKARARRWSRGGV